MPASCCFEGGPAALWARPRCSVTSALFYRRRELTCASLLPWAGMMLLVLTQIFLLLFTASAELKRFYLKDTTVVLELSLWYNISVAILYPSYSQQLRRAAEIPHLCFKEVVEACQFQQTNASWRNDRRVVGLRCVLNRPRLIDDWHTFHILFFKKMYLKRRVCLCCVVLGLYGSTCVGFVEILLLFDTLQLNFNNGTVFI